MASFYTVPSNVSAYTNRPPGQAGNAPRFGQKNETTASNINTVSSDAQQTAPHQSGILKKLFWGFVTTAALLLAGKLLSKGVFKNIGASIFKNAQGFFSSQAGEWALNLAKSEAATAAIIGGVLSIGHSLLPKSAFQMLKQHATRQNLHNVLKPETLGSLFSYGKEVLAKGPQSAEGLIEYLRKNSASVAENLAAITGFKKESLQEFLKALGGN